MANNKNQITLNYIPAEQCRVDWHRRVYYITYPVTIPRHVAVSFSLFVVTALIRVLFGAAVAPLDLDSISGGTLSAPTVGIAFALLGDQITRLLVYLALLYLLIAFLWISTVAARQNPHNSWFLCMHLRKLMAKSPRELAYFFLTIVQIGARRASTPEFIRSIADEDLMCLICHDSFEREALEREPGIVPALECRY